MFGLFPRTPAVPFSGVGLYKAVLAALPFLARGPVTPRHPPLEVAFVSL